MKKQIKNLDFKLKVLKSSEEIGVSNTAKLFELSRDTVHRWKKKYRQNGYPGLSEIKQRSGSHPWKLSDAKRQQIRELYAQNADLTLESVRQELHLKCSLKTISRIIKETTCINPYSEGGDPASFIYFYFNVEKLPAASSEIPVYLLQIKELVTGFTVFALSNENAPNAIGIFADFFLSRLAQCSPVKPSFFMTCKGRFYNTQRNRLSFFEEIASEKHQTKILLSAHKFKTNNELLNLALNSKKLKREEFHLKLYYWCAEKNLQLFNQLPVNCYPLLLMEPLMIDTHLSRISSIKLEENYWAQTINRETKSYPPLFEHLLTAELSRIPPVTSVEQLAALNAVFTLFELSGCQDSRFESKLSFAISQQMERCNEWDKAEELMNLVLERTAKISSPGVQEFKALEFMAIINENRCNFARAAYFYTRAIAIYEKMIPAETRVNILESAGFCYQEAGRFKEALKCFKKIVPPVITETTLKSYCLASRSIAGVYSTIDKQAKAIAVLKKTLKTLPVLPQYSNLRTDLMWDLGRNYFSISDFKNAEINITEVLAAVKNNREENQYINLLGMLGAVKYQQGKDEEALNYTKNYTDYLLKMGLESTDKLEKCVIWSAAAKSFMMMKNYKSALIYLKKSILFAEQIEHINELANGYLILGDLYLEMQKTNKALKAFLQVLNFSGQNREFKLELKATAKIIDIYRLKQDVHNQRIWLTRMLDLAVLMNNRVLLATTGTRLTDLEKQHILLNSV